MRRAARSAWVATAALALLAVGCGGGESSAEVVSAATLQKDITARLTQAGKPPKSVSCQGGLPGSPGASTRCDVVLSDTNSIQPVVTLTTADPVGYVVNPAVSAEQLAKAVGALLSAPQVSCRSGLDGKTGAETLCEVTRDSSPISRTVVVTNVEGLLMSYSVLPSLGKREVEGLLSTRLAEAGGQRPDHVDCSGDLQGKVGATLDCSVTTAGEPSPMTLTVTKVNGDTIEFDAAPKA